MSKDTQKFNFENAKNEIMAAVEGKLTHYFGRSIAEASPSQLYKAVSMTVRDDVMNRWAAARKQRVRQQKKRLYYLSVEFLIGRSLFNNISNIMATDVYRTALSELGVNLDQLEEYEPEAGLGNGGLGRLAACFMDSLATLDYPAMGCGIRYEYGLFRQVIVDGAQMEAPDNWLEDGNIWEIPAPEDQMEVHFGGKIREQWVDGKNTVIHEDYHTVLAIPYDMPIVGYDTDNAATLRLWSAKSPTRLDMSAFSQGDYVRSMAEKELAEVISKVLYPEDHHYEGRALRLRQQYFFTSATVQYIIKDFKKRYRELPLAMMPEKVAVQINDTHPSLAIPEMMRILLDEEDMPWNVAWDVTSRIFAYTNHTVMSEALERWPVQLVQELLPRVFSIIESINEHFCKLLWEFFPGQWDRIAQMAIVAYDEVRMAHMDIALSHSVNGVSRLHTEILKNDIFKDFFYIQPEKFVSITNGITHRRWLMQCNPGLAELITEAIGDRWIHNPERLIDLLPYAQDQGFRDKFADVKLRNKRRLADWIETRMAVDVRLDSLFDVQAKRLHEYKRQLMNILHVMYQYSQLTAHPDMEFQPRTYLFAAKASPGYHFAKLIIRLIHAVGQKIAADPVISEQLQVVFLPNYSVSLAEILIPAAELSEQISTAGKEASGTGNMKFMMNGALTIGTLDGANVEMYDAVGENNIFIFGTRAEEAKALLETRSYHPGEIYESDASVRQVLNMLVDGSLSPDNPRMFSDIYQALLFGESGFSDSYLVLRDFAAYVEAQEQVSKTYADQDIWLTKAIRNTANSGIFSIDRTTKEYNQYIWHMTPMELG